jgi:hypothetical protein
MRPLGRAAQRYAIRSGAATTNDELENEFEIDWNKCNETD